jgi:hypothetical protein
MHSLCGGTVFLHVGCRPEGVPRSIVLCFASSASIAANSNWRPSRVSSMFDGDWVVIGTPISPRLDCESTSVLSSGVLQSCSSSTGVAVRVGARKPAASYKDGADTMAMVSYRPDHSDGEQMHSRGNEVQIAKLRPPQK